MPIELWSVVLAAGAGRRLSSVTGGTPKQFWRRHNGRTLLEDTLARIAPLTPPSRTVIVVDRTHRPFVHALPHRDHQSGLVFQPKDRGTALGVLLGLCRVAAAAPDALVLLTPSDHGVAQPRDFLSGVHAASDAVSSGARGVVLFGVEPSAPEGDYGWIVPSDPAARGLRAVGGFVEKPPVDVAARLFEADAVWNTMVLVARATALLDLYRRHLPELVDALLPIAWLDAAEQAAALDEEYRTLPVVDFSRDLIGRAEGLALHTWPASMGWSDLGTPDRLERWNETLGGRQDDEANHEPYTDDPRTHGLQRAGRRGVTLCTDAG